MRIAPSSDRAAPGVPEDLAAAGKAAAEATSPAPSPFAAIVGRLGREADHGEALVSSVVHGAFGGRDLGATELIALQAGIYRYGETIDLATKLVDKASTDVRTVVQGQQ